MIGENGKKALKRPTPGKPRGIEAIAMRGVVVGESLMKNYHVHRLFDGGSPRKMTRDDLLLLAADYEDRARALRELAAKKRTRPKAGLA